MRTMMLGLLILVAFLIAHHPSAHQRSPAGHSIYITAVEFKGSTTSDNVTPPAIDPSKLSHGYTYKGPGQADPAALQRWEVASYQFSPAFFFQVLKVGDYHLECGTHAPSMTATIMVLPR